MMDCAGKKIRVLHVITLDLSIKKILIDKMIELEKLGYAIDLMSDDTGYVQSIKEMGFRHLTVPISRKIEPIKDILSILRIYKILKREKYEIVHTHTAKAGMVGRIAARLAGIKVVVHTSHGLPYYHGQSKLRYYFYKNLERIGSFFSDGYFSQNYEDLHLIRRNVPGFVTVGYEGNGVPLDKIQKLELLSNERKAQFREELNIPQDSFVFLMAARFESVKNHTMLFRALQKLPEEFMRTNKLKILLAGEGPLHKKYIELTKEMGISGYLEYLGQRNDIPFLIQISNAALLTSEKEGIPRFLMEAMAFSKPVLATNVLGTNELVVHNITGELVSLNNSNQLADRLYNWSENTDEHLLRQYGQNGYERISKSFTEQIVAKRIDELYKMIFEKKHG